jgi:hypothetical protein
MVHAITRVKDELDILPFTLGQMLTQVDRVIVEDNGSTDGTRQYLASLSDDRLVVQDDPEVGYYQSAAMSRLAKQAEGLGATFVVPFDADEFWFAQEGTIRDALSDVSPEARIAEATVFDHPATDEFPSPWRRAEMLPLRKVACRPQWVTIWQGNHGASYEDERKPLTVTGLLEVRHFPYRSPEQMIRKARNGSAAYAATDLPEEVGAHWRGYGRLTDEQITEVFYEYFHSATPEEDGLIHDPCRARRPVEA